MKDFFKNFAHISDTYTLFLSAEEFIELAETKMHLIKESTYIPAPRGSGQYGKFKVVINDGKYHLIWPQRRLI